MICFAGINLVVVPAKAGTQGRRSSLALDSRLRGNDQIGFGESRAKGLER